jgi:hypothetical protein
MIGFKLERKISIDSIEVKDSLVNCCIGIFLASLYFIFPELRVFDSSGSIKFYVLSMVAFGCLYSIFRVVDVNYYVKVYSLHELGYTENKELWLNAVLNGEIPYIVGTPVAPLDVSDTDIKTTSIEITGEEYTLIKSNVNKALHERSM